MRSRRVEPDVDDDAQHTADAAGGADAGAQGPRAWRDTGGYSDTAGSGAVTEWAPGFALGDAEERRPVDSVDRHLERPGVDGIAGFTLREAQHDDGFVGGEGDVRFGVGENDRRSAIASG